MILSKFIGILQDFQLRSLSNGEKPVIVVVEGLRMPFPDVFDVVVNEDNVEIRAEVVKEKS